MIKFVYFDVGGVIIRDFSDGTGKWEEMKRVMGVKPGFEKEFDELYGKYESEELCLTRDVDSLIPIFSKKFGMKFPKRFSMLNYFINHFEQNISLWPVIDLVRERYKVGLLTNVYVGMFNMIKKRDFLPPQKFDVIIDSTVVGLQKPDPKIYKLAEEKCGHKGKEILFIDNSLKNIDAAKNFDWQVFLYDPKNPFDSSKKFLKFLKRIE